jgi:intracellular multiplication protein IcmO
MAEIKQVKEQQYVPSSAKFDEIYAVDIVGLFLKSYPIFALALGTLLVLVSKEYSVYELGLFFLFTGIIIQIIVSVALLSSKGGTFKSDVLIENNKDAEYMLDMGKETYKHLGDAIKSGINSNLTGRILLLGAEIIKRMGVVIGTTGSGKTVMMKGLIEQQIALGGGLFSTDAKGTIDELKRIFAMVVKFGRLKDFFVLNFANLNNTHTIGILHNGSALMCKEILMSLVSNDDPKWRQVDETHIESVLKLLVYKRDNEGLILTFNEVSNYMTLDKLLNEAIKYRNVNDIFVRDFVKYISTTIEIDYSRFKNAEDSNQEFWGQCVEKSQNADLQGVYEIGVACKSWYSVLTTLGSNYGKIFNAKYPDIDLFEAVQNNKIIWVVLPTMESEETAQKIGKLLLGLIKSVADRKIKSSFEPKIPFLFLLDEFGSIGIKGFGRFMSKGRSLGMAIWLFLQSKAQLDVIDDGKALESKEILDNANTVVLLKNKDAEIAEYLSKVVPKETILELNHKEMKTLARADGISQERDYQNKEEDALKAEYFSKLSNGEMYMIQGSEYFKGISCCPSDFNLSYKEKDTQVQFPLNKVYPKSKFINDLRSHYTKIYRQNIVYKKDIKVAS